MLKTPWGYNQQYPDCEKPYKINDPVSSNKFQGKEEEPERETYRLKVTSDISTTAVYGPYLDLDFKKLFEK